MSLAEVTLGTRITLRHSQGGERTEAVGFLIARDAESITLQTRSGEAVIRLDAIEAWRIVRPRPWRIANFLRRGHFAVLAPDVADQDALIELRGTLRAEGVMVLVADPRDQQTPPDLVGVTPDVIRFTSGDQEVLEAARTRGWHTRQYTEPQ